LQGKHVATLALNQDPVALNQDPVALNQDPVALNQDPVALNQDPVVKVSCNLGHETGLCFIPYQNETATPSSNKGLELSQGGAARQCLNSQFDAIIAIEKYPPS
jgi:hypothetical protein